LAGNAAGKFAGRTTCCARPSAPRSSRRPPPRHLLQPGEEWLLSYAVGLGTEVKPEAAAGSGRLTHVKAVKGVLYTTTK